MFDPERLLDEVDVFDFETVARSFQRVRPEAVVNCVGVIKQLPAASDPLVSIPVNSLFPHRLVTLSRSVGARLIHLSTDCVFSGREGMRVEDDVPDPTDLYGRSKCLGEVIGPNCLTLRTSMIGRELSSRNGLLEWFLSRREGAVSGYKRAIYTGLTTVALSRVIADVLERHPALDGLYHVAATPISKYDLLCGIREAFNTQVDLRADNQVVLDRSLDGGRFQKVTGFQPPPWPEMIQELVADPTAYGWAH
jgi:dTDP-4-dehydrorhamnose reductase